MLIKLWCKAVMATVFAVNKKQIGDSFPSKPVFLRVWSTSLLKNTVEKEEIACNEQFLLYPQVFYPFGKLYYKFKMTGCKLCLTGRD